MSYHDICVEMLLMLCNSVQIVELPFQLTFCQQVAYSEIKEETGWKPPTVRLHRRKKYLPVSSGPALALSRESSVSGNTDYLKASPSTWGRLSSSKSSSFSDNSLMIAFEGQGNSEPYLSTSSKNGRHWDIEKTGKSLTDDGGGSDDALGKAADELISNMSEKGMYASRVREEERTLTKPAPAQQPPHQPQATADHSNKPTDINVSTNTTTSTASKHTNTVTTSTDAAAGIGSTRSPGRVPPYGRARSDPQFTRHAFFSPKDLREDKGVLHPQLSRPFRPRDAHVLDWMQRAADLDYDHEHPERQSTVDTLDSGIENESPVYHSFVSGHRRLHRRPYPWSIDLDPSLVRANAAAAVAASGLREGEVGSGNETHGCVYICR